MASPAGGASAMVMWQVRFLIRPTRPRALAFQRFKVGPAPTKALTT